MAYDGFLIKIHGTTDYIIPMEYMNEKSFKGTLSTLDKESYRDANGVLHRTAVLQIPHCVFSTRMLTNTQVAELWRNIRSRYTSALEKKVSATIYVEELDAYITASFYVPDVEMTINTIQNNMIKYEPMSFEFIGYGA